MSERSQTAKPARNQVGLRMDGVIPGSADEGHGVPVGGKQDGPTQTAIVPSDKDIGDAIVSIARRFDEELFALSEAELSEEWYFRWDDRGGVAWNIYQFSDMLEMHKRRCRRWEEHHHGSECVVERVRDKYLMPRIKVFAAELASRGAA